jgi:dTDP-4-amino-4,6-dideoxygalactose transaminase
MNERVYLSAPDVGIPEMEAAARAIKSGWVAPLGPEVDLFESEVADHIGVRHAVALSSGTAALHLGLLALGVKPGDYVVTSTMTFVATANAILYTGATPYFVDSIFNTGNMNPLLLRKALEELKSRGQNVAAIVPVDLLGKAVSYSEILKVADDFEIPVLADAAESLGATHKGIPSGKWGEASVFSFNGNKIMTTSGGGMFVTDNTQLADRVRFLSTQAREPVLHYEHSEMGFNYRLSNVLAAIGRAQLARLDSMILTRRKHRERYRELFAPVAGVHIFDGGTDLEDNCWLSCILIQPEITGWTSNELCEYLQKFNVETRPLWKPMHLQNLFADSPSMVDGSSQLLFENGLSLPSGSAMKESEFKRVFSSINSFLLGAR